ncbi:hypothetical protein K493DRAFT_314041 [Basidiobolus meristosporus CBS 931.73]|uniref:Endosome-associated-trafficking regulator 1 n=1 Tax=Basidiobolus meristosporus CBS 931.73 TaxID=1314790 RepID=A0A1Y1YHL0_9FUNG|nr:hypothetical protein K493DRAFT_314041 [Basidiobolus meristosporus CBS 931.73]|eukprot:ORX97521.1 hypothetical protein K493DRAFT_314041 [Basidiobolus meristosporus CBS 931.73]
MITHCSSRPPTASPKDPLLDQTEPFPHGRPLPQVPLLSPKPVRARPTLPPKVPESEVLTYLHEGSRGNPVSPTLLYFYSNRHSPTKEPAINEDIYRTEDDFYSPSSLPTEKLQMEEGIPAPIPFIQSKTSESPEMSQRKSLPSPPVHKRRQSHPCGHTLSKEGAELLSEEADAIASDTKAFTRIHSTQAQAGQPARDYGELGKSRSTKPLPKPRAVSGALEQTQGELKRAYFQVTSLQSQLASQQDELLCLQKNKEKYEETHSKLSSQLQTVTQSEKELRKELLELKEQMGLLRMENERLQQENERQSVESQRVTESLSQQVNYLKVELIKSANFANSAISQISMGITNVNQVMEYLNGLGKISTQD